MLVELEDNDRTIAYPPVEAPPTGTFPDDAGPPGTTGGVDDLDGMGPGATGLEGAGIGTTGMVDPFSLTDETETVDLGTPLGATVTVK